jgi:excisionase family DNA binding protein
MSKKVHDSYVTERDEELLTVKEMAGLLKIPANTGYKMLLSRQIPSFKMGKLRRVRRADVVDFINAHRVEALSSR